MLNKNGVIMIRIPVKYKAFEDYYENWYQIDAPRHFYLHTKNSLKILSERNGLEIFNAYFDSTFMQFVGSIEYENDISYNSSKSYRNSKKNNLFSNDEIKKFILKANHYNKNEIGDQAVFFLKKTQQD